VTLRDQDSEQLREEFSALSERAVPSTDCPDAGVLWDALDGKMSSRDVRHLLDHTISCPACAESWRLARQLRVEAGLDAETAPARPLWSPWWKWSLAAAAAASIVLAVTVGIVRFRSLEEPGDSIYREASGLTIRSLVPESVPLPRNRCVLRWTPGPAKTRYDVRVATEDLTILARARELEKAEYRVPEAALTRVPAGARLVWQVEAVLSDGRRVGSPAFLVRLESSQQSNTESTSVTD